MKSRPSLLMRVVVWALMRSGSDFKGKRFIRWRRQIESRPYPSPAPVPKGLKKRYEILEQTVNGQMVFTLTPRRGKPSTHILYTHGGAYVLPLQWINWNIIQALLERTGASMTLSTYPLAPEHTYKQAFAELEVIYRHVSQEHAGKAIVLCGDSSGGGLALAQALRYRDLGLRLPDRIVLLIPWLDITLSNPGAAVVEPDDPVLGIPALVQCGQWWAGGDDPCNPLLSPIYGNLSGLPPIDIFQGTADIFIADARKLKERVSAAGGQIQLYEYPGAFHGFMGVNSLPEARDVFERIASTLE